MEAANSVSPTNWRADRIELNGQKDVVENAREPLSSQSWANMLYMIKNR